MIVDARMGDVFMGEEAVSGGPRRFAVHAQGYTDLARVDIVRNGDVVHVVQSEPDLPSGWVQAPIRLEWGGSHQTTVWDGDSASTEATWFRHRSGVPRSRRSHREG